MQQIEDRLDGYDWKFTTGERVRLAMEPEYGATLFVLSRSIGEEITGAHVETYDCRRNDGLLMRFYAAELVSAEND